MVKFKIQFFSKIYDRKFNSKLHFLYSFLTTKTNVLAESNSNIGVNKLFRLQNGECCRKDCQGNINSIFLCRWIMAQSLITQPHLGFPLLLSDPSFSSVPEMILEGCSLSSEGLGPNHLLPHGAVVMQAAHQMITSTKHYGYIISYAAHLKILCLVILRFFKSIGPLVGPSTRWPGVPVKVSETASILAHPRRHWCREIHTLMFQPLKLSLKHIFKAGRERKLKCPVLTEKSQKFVFCFLSVGLIRNGL